MIHKKGQAVFIGVVITILAIISFFLVMPVALDVVAAGNSQINQPFVQFVNVGLVFFVFVMIIFAGIRFMRSE